MVMAELGPAGRITVGKGGFRGVQPGPFYAKIFQAVISKDRVKANIVKWPTTSKGPSSVWASASSTPATPVLTPASA